jgi:AcrR family transcriptional regulator
MKRRRPSGAKTSRRRSQLERREETQGAVLDATVDCLARLGYARTTTTRIAREAGVSRGALLHYYASKEQLLTCAVEHIFKRRVEEFRKALAQFSGDANRRDAAVDLLWLMFSGPTFHAWLELAVAGRSNRKLQAEVSRITRGFADTVQSTYRELFPASESPGPLFDLAPSFAFTFFQGLALDRFTIGDERRSRELVRALKAIAEAFLGESPPPSRGA